MPSFHRHPRQRVALLGLMFTLVTLSGCGTLHGSAQGGSGMKPRFGTSISVPIGK